MDVQKDRDCIICLEPISRDSISNYCVLHACPKCPNEGTYIFDELTGGNIFNYYDSVTLITQCDSCRDKGLCGHGKCLNQRITDRYFCQTCSCRNGECIRHVYKNLEYCFDCKCLNCPCRSKRTKDTLYCFDKKC